MEKTTIKNKFKNNDTLMFNEWYKKLNEMEKYILRNDLMIVFKMSTDTFRNIRLGRQKLNNLHKVAINKVIEVYKKNNLFINDLNF